MSGVVTAEEWAAIPLRFSCGSYRVAEPRGGLPQAARRLLSEPELPEGYGADYELSIAVERLNVDSASFRQMKEAALAAGEEVASGIAERVADTVRQRGKMHNPVSNSGGVLLGRVARIGSRLPEPHRSLRLGERIVTLVSLTLTPLRLDKVHAVHMGRHQVDVDGRAVLFASGSWGRLPSFMAEPAALAALDVAGAAPQATRLITEARRAGHPGRLLVLGCGGTSGLIVSAAARRAGAEWIVGVDNNEQALRDAAQLGACHALLAQDATDAVRLAEAAIEAAGGELDAVMSCVNVPGVEMSAILSTRAGGTVFFFSTTTSFTAAALGAEGVSKDIRMLIGNGYCPGNAEATFELLRADERLRLVLEQRCAPAM